MTPALERLLVETVAELFLAYDSPVHRVTGHFTQSASSLAAPNLLVSALDVSGPPSEASIAKGRVLLLTSFDFLASCRPEGFTEVLSPTSARDWIYVRQTSPGRDQKCWARKRSRRCSGSPGRVRSSASSWRRNWWRASRSAGEAASARSM